MLPVLGTRATLLLLLAQPPDHLAKLPGLALERPPLLFRELLPGTTVELFGHALEALGTAPVLFGIAVEVFRAPAHLAAQAFEAPAPFRQLRALALEAL